MPTGSLWLSAWPVEKLQVFGGRVAGQLGFDKAPCEARRATRLNLTYVALSCPRPARA